MNEESLSTIVELLTRIDARLTKMEERLDGLAVELKITNSPKKEWSGPDRRMADLPIDHPDRRLMGEI